MSDPALNARFDKTIQAFLSLAEVTSISIVQTKPGVAVQHPVSSDAR